MIDEARRFPLTGRLTEVERLEWLRALIGSWALVWLGPRAGDDVILNVCLQRGVEPTP